MSRIHIQTLGCRLNQAESERIARAFRFAGHEITPDETEADVRVVNTCTVTAAAGRDSRSAIRRFHPGQKIVATGCHAERHPDELAGADWVAGNAAKDNLAALVLERFGMEGPALGMAAAPRAHERIYPLALDTTRAFVKIQDGCNLRCSFCLTTLARGPSRSRDAGEILDEIKRLSDQGCQEAVLTGVHAGSYGLDLHRDLGWLVDRILGETAIPRLRLSSLEPWNFKSDWTALWHTHGERLCRQLHMSLQSGSRTVLRRMRRHYDPATFLEKITSARTVPGMMITTDLIAGFPGESDEEHLESVRFARACEFAGAHVFTYSARAGTDAAGMTGQIPGAVRKSRWKELNELVRESAANHQRALDGSIQSVLWEKPDAEGRVEGLTDTGFTVSRADGSGLRNRLERVAVRWSGSVLNA